MAKKNNKVKPSTKLSDIEKEQQRIIIPFDAAKEFTTNLSVILENDPLFSKWGLNKKFTSLKGTSLKIEFVLKPTAIEKILEEMDPAQKTVDMFADPDDIPPDDIEPEPI